MHSAFSRGLIILIGLVLSACANYSEPLGLFKPAADIPKYPATPSYASSPIIPEMGKVGVINLDDPPELDFHALLENRSPAESQSIASEIPKHILIGAAGGTASGALIGTAVLFSSLGACLNPMAAATCPAVGAYIAGGAALGGVIGAVVGNLKDQDANPNNPVGSTKDVSTSIAEALITLNIKQALMQHTLDYGNEKTQLELIQSSIPAPFVQSSSQDYSFLKDSDIDTILELKILKASLDHDGSLMDTKQGGLTVTVRARLIRVRDGYLFHEATYRFVSEILSHTVWAENNAYRLQQTFERAYQDLSEQIIDHLFLIYTPPSNRNVKTRSCNLSALKPIFPAGSLSDTPTSHCNKGGCRAGDIFWSTPDQNDFVVIDSLHPQLKWARFPSGSDINRDSNNELSGIENVRYEIRIFEAEPFGDASRRLTGKIIERHTTSNPDYKTNLPLGACGRYFWSWRAFFELEGKPRVTEWSGMHHEEPQECTGLTINRTPSSSYIPYAFMTSCEGYYEVKRSQNITPQMVSAMITGNFLGKQARKGKFSELTKAIDLTFRLENKSDFDVSDVKGKLRLIDENGKEIGTVNFHHEGMIPRKASVEITSTVYPIVFFAYFKLKEIESEKIIGEITVESVGYSSDR